ncbi:MAG: amino acid ABC transporter substrate-binding protein [Lentisphaeria bacterium]
MKKLLLFALVAAVCVIGIVGCSRKEAKTGKSFIVGFDADFPPYGFKDKERNLVGYDLDLAAEVAKRNGWKLKLKPINWDSKDMELDAGTIDCIWNGFTINGREGKYEFTEPYADNSQVFMVKKSSGIKTFADLKGAVVAVQTDTPALKKLQSEEYKDLKASFKNLLICPDFNTAFMNLDAGAAQAVAIDVGVANFQMKGREAEFSILKEVLMAEQYAVGFKLGKGALRDAVQKTMKAMVADGTFAKISEKWFDGKNTCTMQP